MKSLLTRLLALWVGRPGTSPAGQLDHYDLWASLRPALIVAWGEALQGFLQALLRTDLGGQGWLGLVLLVAAELLRRRRKPYSNPFSPVTPPGGWPATPYSPPPVSPGASAWPVWPPRS